MIGGTVGPVSSVGRAPDLQAGGCRFESCIGHTFSSFVYFISEAEYGTSINQLLKDMPKM